MLSKKDFILSLAEENKIVPADASRIVNLVFGHIKKHLLRGEEVRIDNVGRFGFRYREPKIWNNNITGKTNDVGPRIKLRFSTFETMQDELNNGLAKVMAKSGATSDKHDEDDD